MRGFIRNSNNGTRLKPFLRLVLKIGKASPWTFFLISFCFLLSGIFEVFSVKTMADFFNGVTAFAESKGTLFQVIAGMGLFFLVKGIVQILSGISNFLGETLDTKVLGVLNHDFHRSVAKLNLEAFEDASTLDRMKRAESGIYQSIAMVNTLMDVLAYYIPYFILMTVYLFHLNRGLAIAILLVFVPVVLTWRLHARNYKQLNEETAVLKRRMDHYQLCLLHKNYGKETRTLGAGSFFIGKLKETVSLFNVRCWKTERKAIGVEIVSKGVTLLGYCGIMILLLRALWEKDIAIGEFAAVFASVDGTFGMMEEMLLRRMGTFFKQFGSIEAYLTWDLEQKPWHGAVAQLQEGGTSVCLKNVSFRYPNAHVEALKNIDLVLNSGETLAIVGANGSGKTTLSKIILGLYKPGQGQVFHNGQNIDGVDREAIFSKSSAIFQKFLRYELKLSEYFEMAAPELSALSSNQKEALLKTMLLQVGFESNDKVLSASCSEVLMSPGFGGIGFSGGQWQRLAIGRALVKPSELLVMDEPTSAIDPAEELKLYELFREASRGKTTVIVTHRLGAVQFADRILLMDANRIHDLGTHEELLGRSQLYKDMWQAQMAY